MALQWSITVTSAVTFNDVGHPSQVTPAHLGLVVQLGGVHVLKADARQQRRLRSFGPRRKARALRMTRVWGWTFGVGVRG